MNVITRFYTIYRKELIFKITFIFEKSFPGLNSRLNLTSISLNLFFWLTN